MPEQRKRNRPELHSAFGTIGEKRLKFCHSQHLLVLAYRFMYHLGLGDVDATTSPQRIKTRAAGGCHAPALVWRQIVSLWNGFDL
jgi:hypothetical protein